MIVLKSPQEIERMRRAGRIVASVLEKLREQVRPGVTTLALNEIAEQEAHQSGARPAFKGYSGYGYALCCSVNNEVVHGIPGQRQLLEGDIVSLDFGVLVDGFYGDAAITVPVGMVSSEARRLMEATEQSLYAAIDKARAGNRLTDISHAVQSHVEALGYSVVRDFVGHGIGKRLHEGPQIPNFGQPGRGIKLKPGMVLAIEPMINAGGFGVKVLPDGWTAVTLDGALSAHFEHTVAITENGPDILSKL